MKVPCIERRMQRSDPTPCGVRRIISESDTHATPAARVPPMEAETRNCTCPNGIFHGADLSVLNPLKTTPPRFVPRKVTALPPAVSSKLATTLETRGSGYMMAHRTTQSESPGLPTVKSWVPRPGGIEHVYAELCGVEHERVCAPMLTRDTRSRLYPFSINVVSSRVLTEQGSHVC